MSDLRAEIEAALHDEDAASVESATTPDTTEETPDSVSASPDSLPVADPPDVAASREHASQDDSKPAGPIPFDRHQSILENARRKAAEEAEAKFTWVNQFGGQQTISQYAELARRLNADPVAFARDLLQVANIDPQQLLPSGRSDQSGNGKPEPDVLLDNGQMTYSHEGLQRLLAWERSEAIKAIQADLAPMRQAYELATIKEQSDQRAARQIGEAEKWTGFTEHKAAIRQLLIANPQMSLKDAYIQVIGGSFKDAEKRAYDKALADLRQKAQSAGAPSPRSAGAPSHATSPTSTRDAIEAAFRGELDT